MSPRLPAFGKEVYKALSQGLRPPRALYVLRTWPKGEVPLWTLIVPRNDDPHEYDMCLCRGQSVWVKLPRVARDNAGLITIIEAADPEGGVITMVGADSCAFLKGTLARARSPQ